jgi:LysM repeat protein
MRLKSRLQLHAVRLRGLPVGRRLAPLLLLAAALAPSGAHAQRDTIRLGAPRDTAPPAADTAVAPARDPRWSTPFAVEASGRVAPQRTPRDVVWLDADSVRARRRAARLAAAGDSATDDSTAAAPPADSAAAPDTAAAPPPRPTRRAAAADSAAAPRTRRASADTAAAPRRTRASARDSASTRRAASADTAGRARPGTTRPRTHRVASGETLSGIARRYGVTTAQLRALNPDLDGGLDVGTVLRLPAGARAPAADTARAEARRRASAEADEPPARRPAAETRPGTRGRRTHTVAAHETLFGIARRYGVTVDALKAANRLTGDALRTGQTLVIPAAATPR